MSTGHTLPNSWILEFTDTPVEVVTKTQIRDNDSSRNLPDQQISFATDRSQNLAFVTVHESTRWAQCSDPNELLRSRALRWDTALSPFPSAAESDYAKAYAGIGPALPDGAQTNVLFHAEYHDSGRLGWLDENVPGFYASIGIGDIDYVDTRCPIKRVRRLLRSHHDIANRPGDANDDDKRWAFQGLGDPAAVVSFSQDRVLLLATHYSGTFDGQGAQLVLLEAPLSTFRDSAAWQKLAVDKRYHAVPDAIAFEPVISSAHFSRPPWDHCLHPSLCRFNPTGQYIAVFCFNDVKARLSGSQGESGFYCGLSSDCRSWSLAKGPLVSGFVVAFKGKPVWQHPTLWLANHEASAMEVHGWLLCGKSDQTTKPHPYCLWGQPLKIHKPKAPSESLG
jgi:hypothetical protein